LRNMGRQNTKGRRAHKHASARRCCQGLTGEVIRRDEDIGNGSARKARKCLKLREC
jgi:hypothetical protein